VFEGRPTLRKTARRQRHALLLVVFAALTGMFAPAAGAATSENMFGINPGDLFKLSPAQVGTHLTAMKADGIETVRMGAWWSDLENAPPVNGQHTYSWSELDERVAALAKHGLRWAPLLSFSPTWGSKVDGDYSAAPARDDYFASFAAALAERYGNGGTFWSEHPELPALPVASYEIWNEQNSDVYWRPGDAGTYADLYGAAHTAVHQVDDAARVVVGGLAASYNGATPADEFLRKMLAHRPSLRGNIDAVGYHPYAATPEGVYANVANFRRELDKIAGPGIPLELTEIGWTTTDVSEAKRAEYIAELALTLTRSDCGIASFVPYAWLGPEQNSSDREQWFGMVRENATPKTSAVAYSTAIKAMRGIAGVAPSGTATICKPATQAAATTQTATTTRTSSTRKRSAKPRLRLRVRQDRSRPSRVRLAAHCPSGCRLSVQLVKPVRASSASHRKVGFSSRRRTMTLKLPKSARGTRVKVKVTATARTGRTTTVSRTLRLR